MLTAVSWGIRQDEYVARLEVNRRVEIARSAGVVRRQFGDVAHHAVTGVHKGVDFEVIDDGSRCRYRQISKVGPLRLRQELELDRTDDGPLVNRIVAGPFSGGSLAFEVEPLSDTSSVVEAQLTAPLPRLMRFAAPALKLLVSKQLTAALREDKTDLEEGGYGNGWVEPVTNEVI